MKKISVAIAMFLIFIAPVAISPASFSVLLNQNVEGGLYDIVAIAGAAGTRVMLVKADDASAVQDARRWIEGRNQDNYDSAFSRALVLLARGDEAAHELLDKLYELEHPLTIKYAQETEVEDDQGATEELGGSGSSLATAD